jgi:benzoyl-CoA reductase/2-hydroxyglutaryl-CoA dehydratase subunit BcrC/BadD/HgdB
MIQEEKGIPCMMIESHMNDERSFSEGQVLTSVEAFMEMIRSRKADLGS